VRNILFVCLGNICRSPFGAAVATQRLRLAGVDEIRCASAGIRPSVDGRSPEDACEAAKRYGLTLDGHNPRALTSDLVQANDLIVVMEWSQVEYLRSNYPGYSHRIVLLSLFDDRATGAYERCNIEDPFGRPATAYEACFGRIDWAVQRLLAAIRSQSGCGTTNRNLRRADRSGRTNSSSLGRLFS
jgi:protein-tyrosine phosphatase